MRGRNVRVARSAATGSCAYSAKRRRGGYELVMECGSCGNGPGLDNPRCFRNVLDAVQREGMPLAVTMRSHVEKRYGPVASGTMGAIAGVLNRVGNLQQQLALGSAANARCRECAAPLSARLAGLAHCLRTMDMAGGISSAEALGGIGFGAGRSGCADCRGMAEVMIADIESSCAALKSSIVRNGFGIVEG